jgi:hypothetical protein
MILFKIREVKTGMVIKKKIIIDVIKDGKVVAQIHSIEDGFKIESEKFKEVDISNLKCISSTTPVVFIKF